MPDGSFPTDASGNPMTITQAEFESCCCTDCCGESDLPDTVEVAFTLYEEYFDGMQGECVEAALLYWTTRTGTGTLTRDPIGGCTWVGDIAYHEITSDGETTVESDWTMEETLTCDGTEWSYGGRSNPTLLGTWVDEGPTCEFDYRYTESLIIS